MGHRHINYASHPAEMNHNQLENSWHHDSHVHFEDRSFLLPIENAPANAMNSVMYFNTSTRSNDHPSTSFNLDTPNYRLTNSVIRNDPHLHVPPASSSNQIPPSYTPHGPYGFNRFTSGQVSSTYNPPMDKGRLPFKRKNPTVSMSVDRGSTRNYYSDGNSSNVPISSDHLQQKPLLNRQCSSWGLINNVQDHRSYSHLTVGEGSQRNVRSRLSHASNAPDNHLSNYQRPHYHSVAIPPAPSVAGQWNNMHEYMASDRRIPSSGVGCFNHEINQSLTGRSYSSSTIETDMAYNSNFISTRDPRTTLPSVRDPSTPGMGFDHSSYGQRTTPYRAMSSYTPVELSGTGFDGRRAELEVLTSSRQSRLFSVVGRGLERNERARDSYNGYHSFTDEDNSRIRWPSQGVMMMDQSTYYDSRNMFDAHQDLRLEIDNMSYEELLALGERIGDVCTGLSEDAISRCLLESIYYSSYEIRDEGNCVICLEEYMDGQSLGRLNCGHDFHFSCIKKWLQIKNLCPICKASALEDTSKQNSKWK